MKKIRATIATGLAVLGVVVSVLATPALAVTPLGNACADNSGSVVCTQQNDAENKTSELLKTVISILMFVLGAISVIMIVIGGLRYTTSGGDASQIKSAKDTILYAVVGLVVAIMAYAIVNFVLTQL